MCSKRTQTNFFYVSKNDHGCILGLLQFKLFNLLSSHSPCSACENIFLGKKVLKFNSSLCIYQKSQFSNVVFDFASFSIFFERFRCVQLNFILICSITFGWKHSVPPHTIFVIKQVLLQRTSFYRHKTYTLQYNNRIIDDRMEKYGSIFVLISK